MVAESFVLRLRAAWGHISRELVADLARSGEGRILLEQHHALLREKKAEDGALVVLSALALLERLAPHEKSALLARANVPRTLADAIHAGRLVEPRRQVAWRALRERADTWARARSRDFVEGLDRLAGRDHVPGVEALVAEETVRREAPKVGRNDPCPCGSGKKFKKCCEQKQEEGAPSLTPILRGIRWTEELYAASPERQLELAGDLVFREHLALLQQAERPRKPPRDEPYLALAVLARVLQSRTAPAWARELALGLATGPGHEALDRGAVAAWLLESFPDERASLAGPLARAIDEHPLTLEGAVALGLALVDAGAPDLALAALTRDARRLTAPPGRTGEARLAFVRALAARATGAFELARRELDAFVGGLDGPDAEVLRVAAREARAGLEDPEERAHDDERVHEDDPADDGAADPPPAAPVVVAPPPADERAPGPTISLAGGAPLPPPRPVPPRQAPLLDEALPAEVATLARARDGERAAAFAALEKARHELEAAREELRGIERELARAKERTDKARKAAARIELDAAARERVAPPELTAVERVLAEAKGRIEACLREPWKRPLELTVPVVASLTPQAFLLLIPIPAEGYFGGTLAPELALLGHATVAAAAEIARQSDQREESIRAGTALGFVAVLGDAPLARFRDRAELWALALDDAWSNLALGHAPRLAPVLAPLPAPAAAVLLGLVRPVEPVVQPGEARHGDAPSATGRALSVEDAAERLGTSPFVLARALGARSLWDRSGAVVPGVLETVRLLERSRGGGRPARESNQDPPAPGTPAADAGADPPSGTAGADPLEADQQPARRALRVVLRRLIRFGKIGASHTRVDNALRGAPPHLRGVIKHAVDVLITVGVFRSKPTLNGLHISIEPQRIREVDHFVLSGESPWPKVTSILETP
jgi:hypothetical protein